MRPNVVLWGCPRSGTSLLLELFEALGWSTYFEPGMDFVTDSLLPEAVSRNNRPWAIKNPIDVGGYRTPGLTCSLRDLRAAVGTNYVSIWLVRHPLDTVCSLRKGLDKWRHQPLPADYLKLSNTRVDERGVGVWMHVNGRGLQAAKPDTIVRYEDLLSRPDETIATLAEIVGEAFPRTIINAYTKRISAVSGVNEAAHQSRWTMPHGQHAGRWRTDMNFDQVEYAVRTLGSLPADFGYALPVVYE